MNLKCDDEIFDGAAVLSEALAAAAAAFTVISASASSAAAPAAAAPPAPLRRLESDESLVSSSSASSSLVSSEDEDEDDALAVPHAQSHASYVLERGVLEFYDAPRDEARLRQLAQDASNVRPRHDYLMRVVHSTDPITLRDRNDGRDYIRELTRIFHELVETTFLAQHLYDRFLSVYALKAEYHLLAACSCWFLAVKVLSADHTDVTMQTLLRVSEPFFNPDVLTPQTFKSMESVILHHLNWRLCAVTPCTLLEHMLPFFRVPEPQRQPLVSVACTLLQMMGQDYELLAFHPVAVPLAIIRSAFVAQPEIPFAHYVDGLADILAALAPVQHSEAMMVCVDQCYMWISERFDYIFGVHAADDDMEANDNDEDSVDDDEMYWDEDAQDDGQQEYADDEEDDTYINDDDENDEDEGDEEPNFAAASYYSHNRHATQYLCSPINVHHLHHQMHESIELLASARQF